MARDALHDLEDEKLLQHFLNPFNRASSPFTKFHQYSLDTLYAIHEAWDASFEEKRQILAWHKSTTEHTYTEYIDVLIEAYEYNLLTEAITALSYAYKQQNSLTIEQLYTTIEQSAELEVPIEIAAELVFDKETDEILLENTKKEEREKQRIQKKQEQREHLKNLRI